MTKFAELQLLPPRPGAVDCPSWQLGNTMGSSTLPYQLSNHEGLR
jgi:hypothetical protein